MHGRTIFILSNLEGFWVKVVGDSSHRRVFASIPVGIRDEPVRPANY